MTAGDGRRGALSMSSPLAAVLRRPPLAVPLDLPVREGDVTRLDVRDGSFAGYVSLGVMEHRREGPYRQLRGFSSMPHISRPQR